MDNREYFLKKLVFRATHRGTREMDIYLGGFIKNYIKLSKRNKNKEFVRFHVRIIESLAFISFNSLIHKLPKHKTIFLDLFSPCIFIDLLHVHDFLEIPKLLHLPF